MEGSVRDSKIFQGVTSEIGGNCGDSPYPSEMLRILGNFTMRQRLSIPDSIFKSFVGQGQLRSYVVGDNDVSATAGQLTKMQNILEECMEQGAAGISCGLEYTPGSYATDEEIAALCKIVAKHDGLFAIHMRNEDDRVEEAIKEAIEIANMAGVRLEISHLKSQNAAIWHKAPSMLSIIEKAWSDGLECGI